MRVLHRNLVLILVLLAVAVTGCDHGPKMYKVSGKVLYKDGSVPKGGVCVVQFVPTRESTAEIRKGAGGPINADGTFEMHTKVAGDGVYPGEYAVTFAVWPGPMDPRPLVDPKYINPKTTPYKVTVDRNISDLEYTIEPLSGAGTAAKSSGGGALRPGGQPAGG